jgi:N-acetylglutamate synthase-like GNAT family acetyltransferase
MLSRLATRDGCTSHPLAAKKVGSIGNSVELVRIVRANDGEANADCWNGTEQWVERACQFLENQWPRESLGEDQMSSYRDKIIHDYPGDIELYGLPCSYLLVNDGHCIGHGRLTECFENAGGNAAAVTFVVIDSFTRGQRLGTCLMQLLEEEAKRLGYHYIYLWTTTAISFYEKNGYQECQRVSLKRACLKSLESSQVEGLEALLLRKCDGSTGILRKPKMTETIMLARNSMDASAKDVWMRKRLVEHVGSHDIALSERLQELRNAIAVHQESHDSCSLTWKYFLQSIPWQAQIGPSCGLAALRMIREYYLSQRLIPDSGDHGEDSAPQLPSLLSEAQARGYTHDGEVFDANNWMRLAIDVCGMDCEIMSTQTLQPSTVLDELRRGGVWILPYDSNQRTRLPGCFKGKNAHYGIMVGLLIGYVVETGTGHNGSNGKPLDLHSFVPGADQGDSLGLLPDQTSNTGPIMLLVQHSLSSQLSIAYFQDFVDSNLQLEIVDHSKFGVQRMDLKNRIILCRGIRSDAF